MSKWQVNVSLTNEFYSYQFTFLGLQWVTYLIIFLFYLVDSYECSHNYHYYKDTLLSSWSQHAFQCYKSAPQLPSCVPFGYYCQKLTNSKSNELEEVSLYIYL